MSKDFAPTKKDLLTVESLILDIKTKKNQLVGRKMSLQNSLSQLRDKYKDVEHNSPDFKRIKNTRQNIKDHLNGIELKIKSLNEELVFKNKLRLEIEFYLKNNKRIESKEDVERMLFKINKLKEKYSDFSKDRTRISSLRVMACEFIDDLNDLIEP